MVCDLKQREAENLSENDQQLQL